MIWLAVAVVIDALGNKFGDITFLSYPLLFDLDKVCLCPMDPRVNNHAL